MPDPGSKDLAILLFLHTGLLFVALISVSILTASMIADVTDATEAETGERHEGLFAAVIAFVIKATSGLGTLLAGIVLDVVGFPRNVAANAPAEAISLVQGDPAQGQALGAAVGVLILVLFVASVACLMCYPLRRADHEAMRQKLAGVGDR